MAWWNKTSKPDDEPDTPSQDIQERFEFGFTCPNGHTNGDVSKHESGLVICSKCGKEAKPCVIKVTFEWGSGILAGYRFFIKDAEFVHYLESPKRRKK